jgi:hypothetical protein
MNEDKVVTWIMGFCIGIMFTVGADRFVNDEPMMVEVNQIKAEEIIMAYNQGREDALQTNPVSFELEETCLSVWANKQFVGAK